MESIKLICISKKKNSFSSHTEAKTIRYLRISAVLNAKTGKHLRKHPILTEQLNELVGSDAQLLVTLSCDIKQGLTDNLSHYTDIKHIY